MGDETQGKRPTKQFGSFVDEEKAPAAPAKRVGKRSFNAGEARGLAAFDRKPADDDEGGASKGAARFGGSAGSASHKPGAPSDDEDLRAARLEASHEHDDDDMVATSRSFWDEVPGAAPAKGRKGRAVAPEGAEEGEEEPPRKRSSAWKWIGGTALLAAVGVGTGFGIMAAQRSSSEGAGETSASGAKAESTTGAKPAAPPKRQAEAEPDDEQAAEKAAPKSKEAAGDSGQAGAKVAETKKASPDMNVSQPAAWAPGVEASNPWVALAPAPAGHVLGLSASEVSDSRAASRTGFHPEAKLMAPQKAYRIESHEVTWGEIAKAASVPEAATFARPKWLPSDVARQSQLPATGVPWAVAEAFCRGMGGDLPSEAEWEWAARGPDDRYLPWGRAAFDTSEVHTVASGAVPVAGVKTSKLDRTPGDPAIFDLLGNAQEWTRDAWRPADPSAPADPRTATHKAIRGWPLGDPGASIPSEGSTYRAAGCADPACMTTEGAALERVGFRCVRDGG